jgi:cysteine desulfurase
MQDYFANPSSLHRLGVLVAKQMQSARQAISTFAGVPSDWLIFTGSATEANQTVLFGQKNPHKNANHILMTNFEHASVREAASALQDRGYIVEFLNPNENGFILKEELLKKIKQETILVSIIGVHNELGVIQDISMLGTMIKQINPHAFFHVDAVQWLGKIPLPALHLLPDYLTFSAHIFHGPKGIGGIFKKPKTPLKPLLYGGGQERKFRSGTENVPAIISTATALENLDLKKDYEYVSFLEKIFFEYVGSNKKLQWISPNPGKSKSPYICLLSVLGKKSEVFIHELEQKEIYVSSGSACSSNQKDKEAEFFKKFSSSVKEGMIRVSFSRFNTKEEVEQLIKSIEEYI